MDTCVYDCDMAFFSRFISVPPPVKWCGVLALHPRLNPHNPQVAASVSRMGKGISASNA
jgi:hypothetical protein